MVPLLVMLGCASPALPPSPTEKPTSDFDAIGSGATVHLARLPATLDLPERTLETFPEARFVLDEWTVAGDRRVHTACPVRVAKADRKHIKPPTGLSVEVDGRPVPYRLKKGGKGESWYFKRGRVHVRGDDLQNREVVLVSDRLDEKWRRLELAESGLRPEEYVQRDLTWGTRTREGLLLPAPGSITWTVEVPRGAHLETGVSLIENGLVDVQSNGATLLIEVDGQEVERRFVDDTDYVALDVDLRDWGGQTVELRLSTLPHEQTDWDHVFVAAPMLVGEPKDTVRRVVVVGVDTLRYDQVTQHGYHRDTTAPLQSLADSSVVFDNAWAPAPRTRPSFRTSTTGAYPFKAIDTPTFGQVFQGAGFVTGGITANVHLVPEMGFTDGFDYWQFENSVDADVQIRRAKEFLRENEDRDTFLFLHLMDPHNFYRAPGTWRNKYVEHEQGSADHMLNRWQLIATPMTPDNKEWLRDRYDGEIAFMADQLAGFVRWLDELDGQTLFAMHSDHGEEFWEHGSYEHNHTLYSEVVQANLWMRPPGGWGAGARVEQPVSLVDLAPTLYDMAGVKPPPDLDGVSLRPLLDAGQQDRVPALEASLDARPLQISHLMYDQELWAVVADGWKYILRTCDGHEELYDLKADPKEQDDRIDAVKPAFVDERLERLSGATGFAAGRGFRVDIIQTGQPFLLDFGDVEVQAIVMDPEACESRRANIEWGDMPDHWPADIGSVTVQGGRVMFAPGTHPIGKLVVLAPNPPLSLVAGDSEPLESPPLGRMVKHEGTTVRIEPGPVLIQTDSVARRMGLPNGARQDDEQLDALRVLGYIE